MASSAACISGAPGRRDHQPQAVTDRALLTTNEAMARNLARWHYQCSKSTCQRLPPAVEPCNLRRVKASRVRLSTPRAGAHGRCSMAQDMTGDRATLSERDMISEKVAPTLVGRTLSSFDLVVIFVALVLFIPNASTVQFAGSAAFVFWGLGFLTFLIPGAFVTAQLGRMFPEEGSLYVWTQKALGPFWGFFAGFVAWWPGVLVMILAGALVVSLSQAIDPDLFTRPWQQGLIVLAVLWFSCLLGTLRFRLTQNYVNVQFLLYSFCLIMIGISGFVWLANGHHAANSFAFHASSLSGWGQWTFFSTVVLALLGIEVPLNMGAEIKSERSIKRYLFWGCLVVIVAYLWATWSNMVVVPVADNNATYGIVQTVQIALSHTLGSWVAFILVLIFISDTVVYNYSFARLMFVSGLERRLPHQFGRVNQNKVPANAVLAQTVIASVATAIIYFPIQSASSNYSTKVYLVLLAAVTVVWCTSMVLLFGDVFFVRRSFPERFKEFQRTPWAVLAVCGVVGIAADVAAVFLLFWAPWAPIFTKAGWGLAVGAIAVLSIAVGLVIYLISERGRGARLRGATPTAETGPA
jgi:glutamate:GABA antiporter